MAKRKLNKAQLLRILADQSEENITEDVDECFDEQSDSEEEVIIEASEVEDEISCESDVEQIANTKHIKSVRKVISSSRRSIITVTKPKLSTVNRKLTAVSRSNKGRKRHVTLKASTVKRKVLRKVSACRKIKTKVISPLNSAEFISKDDTKWAKVPYPETSSGKIKFSGIADEVTIPHDAKIVNPVDIFKLFFSEDICQEIVRCTNTEAIKSSKRPEKWKMLTVEELYAFFGLLITAGHMKSCNQNYRIFWHPFYGSSIFQATMGLTRFEDLLRFIRFDDKSTRSERRKSDKLCPIRNIWEKVTGKFRKYYIPSENLTLDEQLMPCRCRCCFIQFMPKKPDKYGIKIFWLCDSKTAYPLVGLVYTGKDGDKRAVDLAKNVVEELCCSYFGTKRNITVDNYFTSFPLAESLLSHGLTLVGTLKKNKTCVPDDFLPDRSKAEGSTMFGFRENMTLVSHVPKVGKGVLFLSTMHHTNTIITEDGVKSISEINKHYNKTKSGVDTMDQMVHEYMIKRKTNRWPFAFFMNLLDVTNIAAYILWGSRVDNAKVMVCQLETPVRAAIAALKRFKGISILNASPPPLENSLDITVPTILCINEHEAASMTQRSVPNLEEAKRAINNFMCLGVRCVIITFGRLGAIFASNDDPKPIHVRTPKCEKAVDTTGAGDAFIEAFAHFTAMDPSVPLVQRVGAAVHIATYSVQRKGTQSSYPALQDLGDFDIKTKKFDWSYA